MPEIVSGNYKTAAELDEAERSLLGVSAHDNTLYQLQSDGSCLVKVRPWQPGMLPRLDVASVRRWAEERANRVQSVVVFGSHARGTDHKYSDVDIFVIGRLSGRDKGKLRDILKPSRVDIVDRTSRSKFRASLAERHLSIDNQVLRHGVQIFGNAPQATMKLEEGQYSMDDKAFLSHFKGASEAVTGMLAVLSDHTFSVQEYGFEEIDLRRHVADSSNAAERTAKAILVSVGLSPEHKHDIPALVEQLRREAHQRRATRTPQGLPDTETLAKRIETMNHETASQALHVLVYHEGSVFAQHAEGRALLVNAQDRFARVIDSLVWLFEIIKGDKTLGALARKCQIALKSCFRNATRRESESAPLDVVRFEEVFGISTSLPATLARCNHTFEAQA